MKKILFIFLFLLSSHKAYAQLNVNEFQTVCSDMQKMTSIITLYNSAVVAGSSSPATTGAQTAASFLGAQVPRICAVVIAASQAKDVESTLAAARVANDLYDLGLSQELQFYDDTTSFVQFVDDLGNPSKGSAKDKFLNIGNHRRLLDYSKKWIAPVVAKQTGQELRAEEHARNNAKILSRSNQMAALSKRIHGCRTELSELAGKNDADTVEIGGSKFKVGDINKQLRDYNGAVDIQETSSKRVSVFRNTLKNMLGEMIKNSQELNSAIYTLDTFINEAYWVEIAFELPTSNSLTGTKTKTTVEGMKYTSTPGAGTASGSTTAGSGTKGTATPNIKTQTDQTDSTFVNQISSTFNFCEREGKARYEASSWLVTEGTALLNNPFVKPESISKAVKICPFGDPESENITRFIKVMSADEIKKAKQSTSKLVKTDCEDKKRRANLGKLRDMTHFGADQPGIIYRKDVTCDEESFQIAKNFETDTPIYRAREDIISYGNFVDYYNKIFNMYVTGKYEGFYRESQVHSATRSAGGWFNSAGGGYGGGFSQEGNPAQEFSPELGAFNKQWRQITRCNSPKYLKDNYGDNESYKLAFKGNPQEAGTAAALNDVVQLCQQDEASVNGTKDIFRYMFNGMKEDLNNYTKSEGTVVRYKIMSGNYVVDVNNRQKACKVNLKPTDFMKANAETNILILDSLNDMNRMAQIESAEKLREKGEQEKYREQLEFMEKQQTPFDASIDVTNIDVNKCSGDCDHVLPTINDSQNAVKQIEEKIFAKN